MQYFKRYEEILINETGDRKKETAWIKLEEEHEQLEGCRRYNTYLSFRVNKLKYNKRIKIE